MAVSGASIQVVSGTTVVAEGTATEAGFTTSKKLEAGTYTIVVTKDGYDKFTTSAVVTDGKATITTVELVKTAAPAIESVVADNLKTLKINFNTEIDKDDVSATTVKVYTGTNTVATAVDDDLTDGVAATKVGYTVSADKKTVTVVFGTLNTQDAKVKVVVDSLKTASADKISGEKAVTVLDTTLPTVSDVKVESSKKFYVYFSEPVQLSGSGSVKVWSDFVVDGKEFAGKVTQDDINSRLIFEPAEKLTSGTKTIDISGVKDYANLPIVKTSKTFTVLVDTAAPELKEVIAESYDELRLVFDEDLSTVGTVILGTTDVTSHTEPDPDDSKVLVVDLSTSGANKEFTTASLVEENTVTVKDQTDAEENKTAEKTVKFVVKDDITAPTATATVNTDNEVVVKFSERVDGAGTAGNYTVKDADGNKVTFTLVSYDAKTKSATLRINNYNNTNGATYTVTIAKDTITDTSVRKNKMAEQKLSVTLKDNKKPEISKIYGANGENKVTIIFSEPMDTTTLAQKGNYLFVVNSSAQTINLNELTESVVTVKDSKTVELTLGKLNNVAVSLAAGDKIAFQNLKDQNGNVIAYGTSSTYVQDTFTQTDVKSVEAVGKTTLKVTLKDGVKFTQVAAKDFVLSKAANYNSGSNALADTNMIVSDAKLSTDGTYVTLTLSKELNTNGQFNDSGLTDLYILTTDGTTVGNASTATKNEIGTPLTIGSTNGIKVQDKIAASVKSVEAVSKTCCNQIKVTFDENISTKDENNFAALQYQIKVAVDGEELSFVKGDFAIESVGSALNADNFVITIKKNGVKSNNVTVALPDTSVLTDGASGTGNAVNTFAATAVKFSDSSFVSADDKYIVEKVSPYLLASASQETNLAKSGKTFQVKFSEAMDKDTVETVSNWTIDTALSGKVTISYNVTTKVATFTVDAAGVSSNNTIVPTSAIKDVNGNTIDFATAGVGKTITITTGADGNIDTAGVTDAV